MDIFFSVSLFLSPEGLGINSIAPFPSLRTTNISEILVYKTPHLAPCSPPAFFPPPPPETDKVVPTWGPLYWVFLLSEMLFFGLLLRIRSQLKCHSFGEDSPEYTIQNKLSLSHVLFCRPVVYLFVYLHHLRWPLCFPLCTCSSHVLPTLLCRVSFVRAGTLACLFQTQGQFLGYDRF